MTSWSSIDSTNHSVEIGGGQVKLSRTASIHLNMTSTSPEFLFIAPEKRSVTKRIMLQKYLIQPKDSPMRYLVALQAERNVLDA